MAHKPQITKRLINGRSQITRRCPAAVWFHYFPEERVIVVPAAVVAYRRADVVFARQGIHLEGVGVVSIRLVQTLLRHQRTKNDLMRLQRVLRFRKVSCHGSIFRRAGRAHHDC